MFLLHFEKLYIHPKHGDNAFTSQVLHRLSYAYKLITQILFTPSDSQYLKLEGGMERPSHKHTVHI